MEKEKQQTEEEANKRIVLTPPVPTKWQKIWQVATLWRPLTKYEGGKFALMILKLSEAILNMERIQKKLIKNNNIIMQQIQGHQMAAAARKAEEEKRTKEDKAFQ
jgi:hypothetical protein